jgi:hypothetical protein
MIKRQSNYPTHKRSQQEPCRSGWPVELKSPMRKLITHAKVRTTLFSRRMTVTSGSSPSPSPAPNLSLTPL